MAHKHMSEAEIYKLEEMQKSGHGAAEIIKALQKARRKAGESGPSAPAVYRAMSGKAYKRGASEQRGRPKSRPANIMKAAIRARMRLAREAKSEHMVTWSDIYKDAKKILKAKSAFSKKVRMPSEDWFQRVVRAETDVRARHGKRRITHENVRQHHHHHPPLVKFLKLTCFPKSSKLPMLSMFGFLSFLKYAA